MTGIRPTATARIALVGDRSPSVRSHVRVPRLLESAARHENLDLDAYWIATDDVPDNGAVDGFDGVWLLPGSPYRSEEGAIRAVRAAREGGVPFLGTCGGFQHAVLEFARNVCGLAEAQHAENAPGAEKAVITPLACSLVGHEGVVRLEAGSRANTIIGTERTLERYHCSYGANPSYLGTLRAHGLCFTGVDESGDVRIAELPGHPFFLATLFQPELAGDGARAHPLIQAFARAAAARAVERATGPA